MHTSFDEYAATEEWVRNSTPDEIRHRLISADAGEKSDIEMSIMTFIALGDRSELEAAFPEFAHANPANEFGPDHQP